MFVLRQGSLCNPGWPQTPVISVPSLLSARVTGYNGIPGYKSIMFSRELQRKRKVGKGGKGRERSVEKLTDLI